ncbi:MarR family winged helix-turn-helix transcriptional regulator [Gordonia caeni]|uniref:MarR family transcriptional regulator n=1 Tax=Gordonia caeni TaxID=1007097 RepID=A0ABP7NLX7_9ACTN
MTDLGDSSYQSIDRLREDLVVFARKIRAMSSGHRLTATQLQALSQLDRVGSMTARALADRERVAPQTIARTVISLEELGMVTRAADPNDARASLISVTETGRQTLEVDRAKRSSWLAEAIDSKCTPVERDLLFLAGRLLRQIADDVDEPRLEAT